MLGPILVPEIWSLLMNTQTIDDRCRWVLHARLGAHLHQQIVPCFEVNS